jgi:hypothetical protein
MSDTNTADYRCRECGASISMQTGACATLTLDCRCGGDLCVCHNHGSVECDGCIDCDEEANDEHDYGDLDDETAEEEA